MQPPTVLVWWPPGVGSLRRMFAFRSHPEREIDVIVNPRVVPRSREQARFNEGWLSFDSVLVGSATVCGDCRRL